MQTLSLKNATIFFGCSLLIRAIVMAFFIQPNGFYKQADSFDYHNCAIRLACGHGMHRVETNEPIFWRTPGYPTYLSFFYRLFGITSYEFDGNASAQHASLWFQIFFASLIPIILFYLAFTLTQTVALAKMLAWISVFHPGLVLASTYLLTEGLALIFFFLFLLFLYRCIIPSQTNNTRSWISSIILAALSLSVYTWMRPMGEFVGFFSVLLIAFFGIGSWKQTGKQAALFLLLFFASLAPWYYRNYQLTGELFFCPTIGTYINCFSVPKILRRTLNKPIEECFHITQRAAAVEVHKQKDTLRGTGMHVSNNICKKTAFPIIARHPWYFIYDWIAEVIKTTFDLYTYQLIPMLDGSYWYDPIEEYLPQKITACLYADDIPWQARSICWIEFIYALLLWIGLFAGLWVFVIRYFINKATLNPFAKKLFKVWITSLPMIGIIVGMTGGFGYGRLRLPAEPLIIILSLTFWYWLYKKEKKK